MESPLKWCRFIVIACVLSAAGVAVGAAQAAAVQGAQGQDAASQQPTMLDRLNQMLSGGKSAWTNEQLATMERLRAAAMKSDYAYKELQHLTDNIGPRLSGSPEAQKAVDYVAGEMRALGAEVTLEKATVPHWIRGMETAELTAWPGQASGTTQKIVLTALGGSMATPPEGITS